jgi:hypothetical protein
MITPHPTSAQIARYRNRSATAEELLWVDSHIGACDQCHAAVAVDVADAVVPALAPAEENDHVTYDEMEQWVDGRISDVEREIVAGHIEKCNRCHEELRNLERDSKELHASIAAASASRERRWLLPAAAMVVITFAGLWILSHQEPTQQVSTKPPVTTPATVARPKTSPQIDDRLKAHIEEVRGAGSLTRPEVLAALTSTGDVLRSESEPAAFSLLAPVRTVVGDDSPLFRWNPVAGASSYDIAVIDVERGDIAGGGATTTTSWRPTKPLERGRMYSWQVTTKIADRVLTAPRPPAPEARFRVASRKEVEDLASLREGWQKDHLALGILLAERGFLDEADREFEFATRAGERRASDFLSEVRSWRRNLRR